MMILKKHQKNGTKGFKLFVQNLVSTTTEKREAILELVFLEDPLYTEWVGKNLYDIKVLFEIRNEHFEKLLKQFANNMEIFIRAFLKTPEEVLFLKMDLDMKYIRQYQDIAEYAPQPSPLAVSGSRSLILEKLHDLQNKEQVPDHQWQLPQDSILLGAQDIPKSGIYKRFYEKNELALEGKHEERLREGEWKHFYRGNKLMALGFYHLGEKVDDWIFYYQNGLRQAQGQYKEDLRQGPWKLWNSVGLEHTVYYKRGRRL